MARITKKSLKAQAPAKIPMKSRPINDQLRNEIINLATRKLFEIEIKNARDKYYSLWWEMFRTAEEQPLNFWCCLPAGWQTYGHYQSRHHSLNFYDRMGNSEGLSVNLDFLRAHVKLPPNFHAFAHSEYTYMCAANHLAMLKTRYPSYTFKVMAEKSFKTLKQAKANLDDYDQQKKTTMSNIYKLLKEVRTTKKLIEVWPEGKRFIPHEPVPVKQALSVDVKAINAALKKGGVL